MIEDPWKNCGQHNESPFEGYKPNSQENFEDKLAQAEHESPPADSSESDNNDSD